MFIEEVRDGGDIVSELVSAARFVKSKSAYSLHVSEWEPFHSFDIFSLFLTFNSLAHAIFNECEMQNAHDKKKLQCQQKSLRVI